MSKGNPIDPQKGKVTDPLTTRHPITGQLLNDQQPRQQPITNKNKNEDLVTIKNVVMRSFFTLITNHAQIKRLKYLVFEIGSFRISR